MKEKTSNVEIEMVCRFFNAVMDEDFTVARSCLPLGRGGFEDRDEFGNTPLIDFSCIDHPRGVEFLLEVGADIEAKNDDGETALMKASYFGRTEVVKVLLEKGADVNAKDKKGRTALMRAHTAEIANLLLKAGAKDVRDNDGWTALMWAMQRKDAKTAKLIFYRTIMNLSCEVVFQIAQAEEEIERMARDICQATGKKQPWLNQESDTLEQMKCLCDKLFENSIQAEKKSCSPKKRTKTAKSRFVWIPAGEEDPEEGLSAMEEEDFMPQHGSV